MLSWVQVSGEYIQHDDEDCTLYKELWTRDKKINMHKNVMLMQQSNTFSSFSYSNALDAVSHFILVKILGIAEICVNNNYMFSKKKTTKF